MEIGFIILAALAVPIIVIWPLLIWVGAFRGIYQTIRNRVRSEATAAQIQIKAKAILSKDIAR